MVVRSHLLPIMRYGTFFPKSPIITSFKIGSTAMQASCVGCVAGPTASTLTGRRLQLAWEVDEVKYQISPSANDPNIYPVVECASGQVG